MHFRSTGTIVVVGVLLALSAPDSSAQDSLEPFFISAKGQTRYQAYLQDVDQGQAKYAFAISGCGANGAGRGGSLYEAGLDALAVCRKSAIATCRLFSGHGSVVMQGNELETIEREALAVAKQKPKPVADIKTISGPITVVYVGSPTCAWCKRWAAQYEPAWRASDAAKKVTFHAVMATKAYEIGSPSIWPADLVWLRDQAKPPVGAPWFYLARGSKLVLAQGGISGWHQVRALLDEALAN